MFTSDQHIFTVGTLTGVLLSAYENGGFLLRPQPRMDDEGNFTTTVDLLDPITDEPVFALTIEPVS